jgi:hypothetical protein
MKLPVLNKGEVPTGVEVCVGVDRCGKTKPFWLITSLARAASLLGAMGISQQLSAKYTCLFWSVGKANRKP